jgi:hypothetical protein
MPHTHLTPPHPPNLSLSLPSHLQHRLLPRLEQNLRLRIRQRRQSIMDLAWLLHPRHQLQVIIHEQVRHDDLDLRRREEAARAGPDAVSKVDVVGAGGAVLVLLLVAGLGTQRGEAEAVESSRVLPEGGVEVDGVRADGCGVALRDDVAGGGAETVGIGDDAGDCDCDLARWLAVVRLCVQMEGGACVWGRRLFNDWVILPREGGLRRWDSLAKESSLRSLGRLDLSMMPPSPTTSLSSWRSSSMCSG